MAHLDRHETVDLEGLNTTLQSLFAIETMVSEEDAKLDMESIKEKLVEKVFEIYDDKKESFKKQGLEEQYNSIEKLIMLRTVDEKWQAHIDDMSHLKEGIHLRAYGQTNPVDAYKMESFDLFDEMSNSIKENTIRAIFTLRYTADNTSATMNKLGQSINRMDSFEKAEMSGMNQVAGGEQVVQKREPIRVEKTVGRNEPCPCGSGKKYKQCCGKQ